MENKEKELEKELKDCGCSEECSCSCKDETGDKQKGDESEQKKAEDIDNEINKIKSELEDWKHSYMRKQAEFQNFTKRKDKEVEELRKFASEKIVTKLLDGLDNLERAIAASTSTKDFDSLVKGVEMILGQLKGIMESEGVEAIKLEGKYDPIYHHAVMVEDNAEFENDDIIAELQKGYTMKGKVIRPTMVKVCKKA